MVNMNYKEQLTDSRWLRKKNEILERDNYTCQRCGATSNLQVHHKEYLSGKLAWEYPNEDLITLCERCHSVEHHRGTKPYFGGVYCYDHSDFTNYMICYGINPNRKEVYLLGVDNGGSLDTPVFECMSFEYFEKKCIHLKNFWDKCYYWSIKEDDKFWQENLIRIFVKVYTNQDKCYYVYDFPYKKESVFKYAHDKMWDLVNINEDLLNTFLGILNE